MRQPMDTFARARTSTRILALTVVGLLLFFATTTFQQGAATAAPATLSQSTLAGMKATPAKSAAAAAAIGVPTEPILMWEETFENVPSNGNQPINLKDYVSTTGTTYTPGTYWGDAVQCNGVVTNYSTGLPLVPGNRYGNPTFPAGMCTNGNFNGAYSQLNVRRMVDVLGQVNAGVPGGTQAAPANGSTAATQNNHAVAAWTSLGQAAAGDINVFQSSPISINTATAHYYTTAVDVAETSCTYNNGINNSKLDFVLDLGGSQQKVNSSPIRACTSPDLEFYTSPVPNDLVQSQTTWGSAGTYVGAGHFYSDRAILLTPAQVKNMRVTMQNQTLGSAGNDFAFDNIRIYDATPKLDKQFVPATITQGGTSRLTFTITNTADLGQKGGWSFGDQLPTGVRVADTPNTSTTCLNGAAAAGSSATVGYPNGTSLVVNGSLGTGMTSCTVSMDVTSDTVGKYTNGPANIQQNGLLPPSDATLQVNPRVDLSITKTADQQSYTPGEQITYTVTVKNAASTAARPVSTATGAKVTDTIPASITGATWTCAASTGGSCGAASGTGNINDTVTIPAGGTITYTITGTVAAGTTGPITNTATTVPPTTATVGGQQYPVDGSNCAAPQGCSASVTTPGSGITLKKTASPTSITAGGQKVTYTFVVTNNGGSVLSNVGVTDAFTAGGNGTMTAIACQSLATPTGTCSGATTTLQPGQSATFTATYTATTEDVEGGTIANTATATATPPSGPKLTMTDKATVTATATPGITLKKTASPTTVAKAGDIVTYSFEVTNSGNVNLSKVSIDDTAFSGTGTMSAIDCPLTSLAPGASTVCTATYAVTQADVNAGKVTNTAVANGTPTGATTPLKSTPSSAEVTAPASAKLTLEKTAAPVTVAKAGDQVTYSFKVTNEGNVTMSNIAVDETAFSGTGTMSAIDCPSTTLAPGASVVCTATYTFTQADVNAGKVTNTAVAQGTAPGSTTPVKTPPSSAEVTAPAAANLSLVKSASPTTVAKAGDTVTYTFTVTNEGNVTMSNIAVDETAFSGTGAMSAIDCPSTTLAPGASIDCTATYTFTQADVNAGKVTNTAVAQGTAPGSTTPVKTAPSTVEVGVNQTPTLSIVKTASPTTVAKAGETVTYSFEVTNTGNVDLTDVSVVEQSFSGTGTMSTVTCPVTSLAAGASTTCSATYVVTQADVNAGKVTNSAIAQGTPPGSTTAVKSPPATAEVTAPAAPLLSLEKTASPSVVTKAAETVTYSFKVTNEGNVTMSDIAVDETAFSGSGTVSAIDCPTTTLAPGASTICTATYTVTQQDADAGKVTNTAVAQGTPPGSTTPVKTPPSSAEFTVTPAPALTLEKTADPTTVAKAGEKVTYSFKVTNTGNVTMTDIKIAEGAFTGTGTISAIDCPTTTLAPGASTTCTATYTVTQEDMDAAKVTNTATATGTPPGSDDPVKSPPSTAVVTAEGEPALTLTKSASPTTVTKAGEVVIYSFTVTNSGSLTMSNLTITEDAFSGTGTMSAIDCPVSTLAPGTSTTCTATYTVTQADVNAGKITNTATAAATPPGSTTPVKSPPATAEVTAPRSAVLSLDKTASPATVTKAGDTVTYSFKITNEGNVTISNVTVNETAFSGTGTLSAASCPVTTLQPGESTTCSATYTVTQADVDAGAVTNTATAGGTPPGTDVPVTSPPSEAEITVPPAPALTVVKSVDPTTVAKAGETVTYSFKVTNTGNVTMSDVKIAEGAFTGTGEISAIDCPSTTLAPGASTTCTATYTVTQADVDAGKVTNTATATGTPPGSDEPVTSPPSSAEITSEGTPALSLVKSASPATVSKAGEVVTYTFIVTNTGSLTMSNVSISEDSFSGTGQMSPIACEATTLAPGASTTCTATYEVTQADVNAGKVTNTATASGTPPNSTTPVKSPPATAVVNVPQAPALALVKSASPATVAKAGESVTYSFRVTNTGNVTIDKVAITEGAFSGTGSMSAIDCPDTSLEPGASTTCTATYVVTQADMDAGKVINTATAGGTPPGSNVPVTSPPSEAEVTTTPAPALTLEKTATPSTGVKVGDEVKYSFKVTNTGNVTVNDISISEGTFTGTGDLSAIDCPTTSLAPGASVTCTATYTVTQADIDAGKITNTATAGGTPPGSDEPPVTSPPSTITVTTEGEPALALVKSASPTVVTKVGQQVTYTFKVTNTGSVTMTNLKISEDAFSGTGTLSAIDCPTTSLAPGASVTCTATYTVTQADMDAGSVTNTATAGATPPGSDTPVKSPPARAVVNVPAAPGITVVKTADRAKVLAAGETITYSFKVTNTGSVTLKNVKISDDTFTGSGELSPIECPATSLAPGASMTCTATYVVTEKDMTSSKISNTATVKGTPPGSQNPVSSPPSTVTVVPVGPDAGTGGYLIQPAKHVTPTWVWASALAGALLLAAAGLLAWRRRQD